jgi:hypothetical protein
LSGKVSLGVRGKKRLNTTALDHAAIETGKHEVRKLNKKFAGEFTLISNFSSKWRRYVVNFTLRPPLPEENLR